MVKKHQYNFLSSVKLTKATLWNEIWAPLIICYTPVLWILVDLSHQHPELSQNQGCVLAFSRGSSYFFGKPIHTSSIITLFLIVSYSTLLFSFTTPPKSSFPHINVLAPPWQNCFLTMSVSLESGLPEANLDRQFLADELKVSQDASSKSV